MAQDRPRRTNVCFHEAGHAFARWYFGYDTDRIGILSSEGDEPIRARLALEDAGGFVQGPAIIAWEATCKEGDGTRKPPHWPDIMRAVEMDLIVTLAGTMAEARHDAAHPFALAGFSGDHALLNATLAQWYVPSLRTQVFDDASDRALALISPKSWPAITALAHAVCAHGRVYKHFIDDILSRSLRVAQPAQESWSAHWPPTFDALRSAWTPPARAA